MNRLPSALLAVAMMVLGCSFLVPKESLYLRSAKDRATQEEVQQQLGSPWVTSSTPEGESQWVYEVREVEAGAQNTWATAGSWCDEYVLTFDSQGILRSWTHKSYFHGGETMPIRCDSGVLKSPL